MKPTLVSSMLAAMFCVAPVLAQNPVPPVASARPTVASNSTDYKLVVGDKLRVEVYRDQSMSQSLQIRPDGKITLQLLGDVQAEGLTPERLAAQIKEAYSQYINTPDVIVSVLAVNSKSFTVSGRVNKVGRWPLVTPVRVFDAIGLAGGFQEFANQKDVQIIRGSQRLKFNYNDYLKNKKEAVDQNVLLQNGDTVVVK